MREIWRDLAMCEDFSDRESMCFLQQMRSIVCATLYTISGSNGCLSAFEN